MQNDDDFEPGLSPSFNSYSSDKLADIADKVCREFNGLDLLQESNSKSVQELDGVEEEEDDEFEFVSFQKSAGEVFFDVGGRIGPVFPVFNRDLIFDENQRELDGDDDGSGAVPSSSSSEVDELEAVPPGSYCVWMPKAAAAAQQEERGKSKIKSKSTGSSSKRWRLRDLLRRSNSDGKDSFVFLTPNLSSSSSKKVVDDGKVVAAASKEKKNSGSDGPHSAPGRGNKVNNNNNNKGPNAVSMAHEVFYVRSKTLTKDGYNKRRSYLPYRQDLVGFFASVNAMGRTFPTF